MKCSIAALLFVACASLCFVEQDGDESVTNRMQQTNTYATQNPRLRRLRQRSAYIGSHPKKVDFFAGSQDHNGGFGFCASER